MLLDLRLVDAPDGALLSLDEAKAHLRIDGGFEDATVEALIEAAAARVDGYAGVLGRALITQTWQVSLPRFDARWHGYRWATVRPHHPHWRQIDLPLPPLQSVTSIAYTDPNGDPQTLDPAQYVVLDGPISAVRLAPGCCWPSTQCDNARAVTITFVAGYGDAGDVPRPIRSAMLLLVGHLYGHREAVVGVENRDSSTELPLGVSALLAPYRVIKI